MHKQVYETIPVQDIVNSIRANGKTGLLKPEEMLIEDMHQGQDNTPVGNQKQIMLIIQETPVRVLLVQGTAMVLGRTDVRTNFYPDLDLTPYGGAECGVSRTHCRLFYKNHMLFVTDLGSSNGTYLNGRKLPPNRPENLAIGDVLALGRLVIEVALPRIER
ncbi:MAG: FHA domain-containing protein [Chloroflexi bacterium]|nr:FHA domain-containing protein [Chloroflexota bacterium]